MVAHPFFLFGNRPSQSYSSLSNTCIDVKTGSTDPGGFCYNSASNSLVYRAVTPAICQWSHNQCANCQHSEEAGWSLR
jgi:hypothetical protein